MRPALTQVLLGRILEHRTSRILATSLLAAVTAVLLSYATPLRQFEEWTYGLRQRAFAPQNVIPMAFINVDDAAIEDMRQHSPTHAFSPIDKVWLAHLLLAVADKHPKAIVVDYLMDTWGSEAEAIQFGKLTAHISTPIIAPVDPSYRPNIDFPAFVNIRYADAAAYARDETETVTRYASRPSRYYSLASACIEAIGRLPSQGKITIRYRKTPYHEEWQTDSVAPGSIAPAYPALDVTHLPRNVLEAKVVFIGGGIDGDVHRTPIGDIRGVEIVAHAVSQMLSGDRLLTVNLLGRIVAAVIFALLGGAITWSKTPGFYKAAFFLSCSVGWLACVAISFGTVGIVLPVTVPLGAIVIGAFCLGLTTIAEVGIERLRYASTLRLYLAPQVITHIMDGNNRADLSAGERFISVVVSDLEDFSGLMSSLDPSAMADVLNGYFSGIIDCLWQHGATLDKMTGDGVIALFGTPLAQEDHADRAVACSRDLARFGLEYSRKMTLAGINFGRTRLGVSSGLALVGNFGSSSRFNYTAYGAVVVLAARLEAANKLTGTSVLISDATYQLIKIVGDARDVGNLTLKGLTAPVRAYSVGEESDEADVCKRACKPQSGAKLTIP